MKFEELDRLLDEKAKDLRGCGYPLDARKVWDIQKQLRKVAEDMSGYALKGRH